MVKVVTSASEFNEELKFNGLVVVDFFAEWCGPCKMIAPLLEKFSKEYSNVKFLKVDVDNSSDIAQKYEISSMPTLIFFKNGEQIQKVIGANPSAIKQAIASNA
ncbi:TRX1 [Candida pseudojiufengensis]|uniref:TRX1 n=1 Tax=Candida pseudojiufengensis TaxID=497109 RepID=UPI00222498BE|nr:TRX1 [Candida pseudojiufengensis]KAI5961874.1 TRX1 [Candida pseudojiufengensis]